MITPPARGELLHPFFISHHVKAGHLTQEVVKDVVPFVLGRTAIKEVVRITNAAFPETIRPEDVPVLLDLPFQTVTIEVTDDSEFSFGPVEYKKQGVAVLLFAHEISPGDYVFGFVQQHLDPQGEVSFGSGIVESWNQDWHLYIRSLWAATLYGLKRMETGTEVVDSRIVVKEGAGDKGLIRINRIVHVHPKKDENLKGIYGGPLDWTHRWEVSGHWRKIEGIGKDRAGAYVVAGATWVNPHVRGPEHTPLVKKTRLIHGLLKQTTNKGDRHENA